VEKRDKKQRQSATVAAREDRVGTVRKGGLGTSAKGSHKTRTITIVQVVLAVIAVAGVVWLASKMIGYGQARQAYDDIKRAYASELDSTTDPYESPIDFEALQKDYPNVVAWLAMDDMDVSYPIVQGEDNEYFLHYDPSGNESIDGSIFLDSRNSPDFEDLHTLVYGHNMIDGSMFGLLDQYVDEEFYKNATGMFTIYTPEAAFRYQIFAVDIVDPTDAVYQVGFKNPQVFGAFVAQLLENSMYQTGVKASGKDHVVTLSTCSSSDRLVISAKRV